MAAAVRESGVSLCLHVRLGGWSGKVPTARKFGLLKCLVSDGAVDYRVAPLITDLSITPFSTPHIVAMVRHLRVNPRSTPSRAPRNPRDRC